MQEFLLVAVIFILGLGAYWSMVLFPRQRELQKRQRYVSTLNAGDEVVTYGGLVGKIIDIDADQGIAHVEIADGVVARFVTAALVEAYDPAVFAQTKPVNMEQEQGQQRHKL